MSRIIALILFLMIAPLLVAVIFASVVLQGRPVFFIQERIGLRGASFDIYKLRTMASGSITSWGKVLRKTGIDEWPQLLNIIKGDMRFIGPRPLTQADIDRIGWNQPRYALRWHVKPGLTGLAQLTTLCHRRATWVSDQYYVNNRTWCLDVCIVMKTVKIVLLGKGDRR